MELIPCFAELSGFLGGELPRIRQRVAEGDRRHSVPVACLRWTQDKINAHMVFGSGSCQDGSVYEGLHDLISGRSELDNLEPLRVVIDGQKLFCLSNQRLTILKMFQATRQHKLIYAPCELYFPDEQAIDSEYKTSKTTTAELCDGLGVSLHTSCGEAWHMGAPLFQRPKECCYPREESSLPRDASLLATQPLITNVNRADQVAEKDSLVRGVEPLRAHVSAPPRRDLDAAAPAPECPPRIQRSNLEPQATSATTEPKRSKLPTRVDDRLRMYYGLQEEWKEMLTSTRGTINNSRDEIRRRELKIEQIAQETEAFVQEQHSKLTSVRITMCGSIDRHNSKRAADADALEASQQRLAEKRGMVRRVTDSNHELQEALRKAARDHDDACAMLREKQNHLAANQRAVFAATLERVNHLNAEIEQGSEELSDVKDQFSGLQDEFERENFHASQLLEFIQRLACGPSATVRTGGGYSLDSAAKREAALLLEEEGLADYWR